jgi:hypothetical protein
MRRNSLYLSALKNLILSLVLIISSASLVQSEEQFPIGLYEAGTMPRWWRDSANGQPCADDDNSCPFGKPA